MGPLINKTEKKKKKKTYNIPQCNTRTFQQDSIFPGHLFIEICQQGNVDMT